MKMKAPMEIEWAAGGIVWRRDQATARIAIVHRAKYNDWVLPKGHPEGKEDLLAAALREVQEETGQKASAGRLAGCYCYDKGDKLKLVLMWHMEGSGEPFEQPAPRDEIDSVQWLAPEEALGLLSHEAEREFLAVHGQVRTAKERVMGKRAKPELDRLAAAINTMEGALDGLVARGKEPGAWWIRCARDSLRRAEEGLAGEDLDGGWGAVHDAERFMVFGMSAEQLLSRALSLRSEAKKKLKGWRGAAIESLFANAALAEVWKNPASMTAKQMALLQEVVSESLFVLHGASDNIYHRMHQVGQQLKYLVTVCMGLLVLALGLAWFWAPSEDLSLGALLPVTLAGAFGGVVSGMYQLSRVGQAKIPAAVLHGLITSGRPVVGAASALFIYAVLKSNIISLIDATDVSLFTALVLGFVSGFSEQYVLATVAKVTGSENEEGKGGAKEKGEKGE